MATKTKNTKMVRQRAETMVKDRSMSRLKEENKKLRQALKAAQLERDLYLRAVYDWVEEQVAKEDLSSLLGSKEGVPLGDIIDELKASVE